MKLRTYLSSSTSVYQQLWVDMALGPSADLR